MASSDDILLIDLSLKAKHGYEEKKVVIGHHDWIWAGKSLFIHLPPVAISITLITFYYEQVVWFQASSGEAPSSFINARAFNQDWLRAWAYEHFSTGGNTLGNSLQIAAKIHEVWAVSSMSAMVLNLARRMLLGPGMPFGLITAAYLVGDIRYALLNPGYRWNLFSKAFGQIRHAFLVVLILISTILAFLIGPASASLLIPTLNWWDVPDPFANIVMPLRLSSTPAELWPANVNATLIASSWSCSGTIPNPLLCPASSYNDFLRWLRAWPSSGMQFALNMQQPSSNLTRQISSHVSSSEFKSYGVATTLSMLSVDAFGTFLTYLRSHDIGPASTIARGRFNSSSSQNGTAQYQPLVRMECSIGDLDQARQDKDARRSSSSFSFDELDRVFRDYNLVNNSTTSFFDWWNNNQSVATIPYKTANSSVNDSADSQRAWLMLCSHNSSWIESRYSINFPDGNLIHDQQAASLKKHADPNSLDEFSGGKETCIDTTKDWLDYLNLPVRVNGTLMIRRLLDSFVEDGNFILQALPDGSLTEFNGATSALTPQSPESAVKIITKLLSAYLADGLARAVPQWPVWLLESRSSNEINMTNLVGRSGYTSSGGSTFQQYVTVRPSGSDSESSEMKLADGTILHLRTNESWQALQDNFAVGRNQGFAFEVERWAYGSGVSSKTLTFALVVNFAYLAFVSIYHVIALVMYLNHRLSKHKKDTGLVNSWDDLQQLLALALNSRPPNVLENAGAGVESKEVWRSNVSVRASEDMKLEMLFEEEDDREERGMRVQKQWKYG